MSIDNKHKHAVHSPATRGHSIAEAADLIGISQRTLWRQVKSDKIRAVRVSARRLVITAGEIERVLSGNVV